MSLGALIDHADKEGNTPLHIAARYGHELLVETLLNYGADPKRLVCTAQWSLLTNSLYKITSFM